MNFMQIDKILTKFQENWVAKFAWNFYKSEW
jgi:hypothetical protein